MKFYKVYFILLLIAVFTFGATGISSANLMDKYYKKRIASTEKKIQSSRSRIKSTKINITEEPVIAVKREFYEKNGKHWAYATDEEKSKFLTKFNRSEDRLSIRDKLRKRRGDRVQIKTEREYVRKKRTLERLEKARAREKMLKQHDGVIDLRNGYSLNFTIKVLQVLIFLLRDHLHKL